MREAMRQQERGVDLSQAGKWSISEWLSHWLEQSATRCEITTMQTYRQLVGLHIVPHLGKVALSKLTVEQVERWQSDLEKNGVGASTRKDALSKLSSALKVAEQRGHVARNVASLVTPPRVTRRQPPPPDAGMIGRLLAAVAVDARLNAFTHVLLGAGLRRSEALALKWSDVNFDQAEIRVQRRAHRIVGAGVIVRDGAKSRAGMRTVPVPPSVLGALQTLRGVILTDRVRKGAAWKGHDKPTSGEAHVFTSRVGTLCEPRNMERAFTRVCVQAGLKVIDPDAAPGAKSDLSFHVLRHAYASVLLESGVQGRVAAELLGHTDYNLTASIYQHPSTASQQAAASLVGGWLDAASGGVG
jgi:integrase